MGVNLLLDTIAFIILTVVPTQATYSKSIALICEVLFKVSRDCVGMI